MVTWLKYGVILSVFFSFFLLIYLITKTFSFGTKELNSQPSGNRKKGVMFAFGRGMMPWEKESAKKHLLTYGAGIIYHSGIFSAFLLLLLDLFSVKAPSLLNSLFIVFMTSALVCGIGLLLKRSLFKSMRSISSPDDFISNILVNSFLLISVIHFFVIPIKIPLYSAGIILFMYIPIGKIRHCFFFFYSRILFGSFFGRRGVYPLPRTSSQK